MFAIIQSNFFNIIKWTLYIGLCGLSVIFMSKVLNEYFSKKCSFLTYEESMNELPTVTFCFTPPNGNIKTYQYESDFNIEYHWLLSNKNLGFLKEGGIHKLCITMCIQILIDSNSTKNTDNNYAK